MFHAPSEFLKEFVPCFKWKELPIQL